MAHHEWSGRLRLRHHLRRRHPPLSPSVHFRGHDDPVSSKSPEPYTLTAVEGRYELAASGDFPKLRLYLEGDGRAFTLDGVRTPDMLYRIEESRGYEGVGVLWSPGTF